MHNYRYYLCYLISTCEVKIFSLFSISYHEEDTKVGLGCSSTNDANVGPSTEDGLKTDCTVSILL